MRNKDIKILWGRSGNRCAICKLELTPDGDKETLGEMAHIVARSSDGPRGNSPLFLLERDQYSNLILLCPTHHVEIDKNFVDWPVAKLVQTKSDHEAWVSKQLETGNITVSRLDNSDFMQDRQNIWNELSRGHIGIVFSLTPLRISRNQIDTMALDIQQALEKANIPSGDIEQPVNRYHTRPTEFGLVNEKFRELPERSGHSFHIFDCGHCEYLLELGRRSDWITEISRERGDDLQGADHVIRYTDVAEAVDEGLAWLNTVWSDVLPFEYLDFRCTILNTRNSTLYSYEEANVGIFGHPTRSDLLEYQDVLARQVEFEQLSFQLLSWVAKCYGLVLHRKHFDDGKHARPTTLR